MFEFLTIFNTVVLVLFLVAGGWVTIRNYFKSKSADKAAKLEAEVQARVAALTASSVTQVDNGKSVS
ncbi:MAG: hypothetical protein [Bacteriophage sp.]|nr:MAG: hypothetical protein [Bacteriophage sp.]